MAANPAFDQTFFGPAFLLAAPFVSLTGAKHYRQIIRDACRFKRIGYSLHQCIRGRGCEETAVDDKITGLDHGNGLFHSNYFVHSKTSFVKVNLLTNYCNFIIALP